MAPKLFGFPSDASFHLIQAGACHVSYPSGAILFGRQVSSITPPSSCVG